MSNRNDSFTKRGPGRRHLQGNGWRLRKHVREPEGSGVRMPAPTFHQPSDQLMEILTNGFRPLGIS